MAADPAASAAQALGRVNLTRLRSLGYDDDARAITEALAWLTTGAAPAQDTPPVPAQQARFAEQIKDLYRALLAYQGLEGDLKTCPQCLLPYPRAYLLTYEGVRYAYCCPHCLQEVGLEGR